MKRITISIDDEIYASIIDYAAETSRQDLARLSVSRAIRKILANKLSEMNYYPLPLTKQQGLQQILQFRQQRSRVNVE